VRELKQQRDHFINNTMCTNCTYGNYLFLFVLTIINEGAYLTFKSICQKALKDGIIAI